MNLRLCLAEVKGCHACVAASSFCSLRYLISPTKINGTEVSLVFYILLLSQVKGFPLKHLLSSTEIGSLTCEGIH